MKKYIKEIDGKSVIKPANQIVVIANGFQTINPSEEKILADGWVEYVRPAVNLTPEQQLDRTRLQVLNSIYVYDISSDVNVCYLTIGDVTLNYWADKAERTALKLSIQDCINTGRDTYRLDLRELGQSVTLSCELALQMLSQLEVYAIDCYNTTTDHIFAVNALTTIEELESYDYTTNYPEKLTFTI